MSAPHIIIIEDDECMGNALRTMLEYKGYQVCLAENAETALAHFQTEKFDLIITDLLLPGMDGAELCRTLREDTTHKHLPIILLSGMTNKMGFNLSPRDFPWLPADHFITKDTSLEQIVSLVEDILSNRDNRSAIGEKRFRGTALPKGE